MFLNSSSLVTSFQEILGIGIAIISILVFFCLLYLGLSLFCYYCDHLAVGNVCAMFPVGLNITICRFPSFRIALTSEGGDYIDFYFKAIYAA